MFPVVNSHLNLCCIKSAEFGLSAVFCRLKPAKAYAPYYLDFVQSRDYGRTNKR
jgi:hypothetical protein